MIRYNIHSKLFLIIRCSCVKITLVLGKILQVRITFNIANVSYIQIAYYKYILVSQMLFLKEVVKNFGITYDGVNYYLCFKSFK